VLIVIVSVIAVAALGRGVWALHRMWSALPRSNADFGIV
jgi:hypothetical protein